MVSFVKNPQNYNRFFLDSVYLCSLKIMDRKAQKNSFATFGPVNFDRAVPVFSNAKFHCYLFTILSSTVSGEIVV